MTGATHPSYTLGPEEGVHAWTNWIDLPYVEFLI
jgi:hypothetical protein